MRLLAIWIPLALSTALLAVAALAPALYATWFEGEKGVIEIAQLLPPAAALAVVTSMLRDHRTAGESGLRRWLAILAIVCVYILGEEISWGQHFLGWGTPDWLSEVNRQQETNLHNTTTWLNEKPRALFEVAVIVGGILHPVLLLSRGRGIVERPWWLAPSVACLPSAILAELWRLPERLFEREWVQSTIASPEAAARVLEFVRYSEMQELYFYYFILVYVLSIRRRLRTKPIRGAAA